MQVLKRGVEFSRESDARKAAGDDQPAARRDGQNKCDRVGTRETILRAGISGAAFDQDGGARVGGMGHERGRAAGGPRELFGAERRTALLADWGCTGYGRNVLLVFPER